MELGDLLDGIKIERFEGSRGIPVRGLSYDSRHVRPGEIFVAMKGEKTDGHLHAAEAVARGAVAIVVERRLELTGPAQVRVSDSRKALAQLAAAFYGGPSSRLRLVGVTGTNGKSTTTFLIESVFRTAGLPTGLIGTIVYRIGDEVLPVGRTTPESLDLQRLLADMVRQGISAVAMEVSSHAIDQSRIEGCDFEAVVFTNLSQDHLDYHGSMERYADAKAKLFNGANPNTVKIINADDAFGRKLMNGGGNVVSFGMGDAVGVRAVQVECGLDGSRLKVETPLGELELHCKLPGMFNVRNALAAVATGTALEIPLPVIKSGIESVAAVPGRFEVIDCGQDYAVVVDYAHTPDALERVLEAARGLTKGRVIAVFGCGGDRDRGKRPLMGEVAGRLADLAIITSDNPRSEDPLAIIAEVEKGMAAGARYEVEADRALAIAAAVRSARHGDFIVVAGKGHETSQQLADAIVPFDDREVMERAIRELMACCR